MSSPAQITANQANSRKSTGPRSAEGKRASSRNNFRHGLYASPESLRGKDRRIYQRILDHLDQQYGPLGARGSVALQAVAILEFRIDRCAALENIYLRDRAKTLRQAEPTAAGAGEPTRRPAPDVASMLALYQDVQGPKLLEKLWRQEGRLRRELSQAYAELAEAQRRERYEQQKAHAAQIANTNPMQRSLIPMPSQNLTRKTEPVEIDIPVPRGAPCPCGSGQKYKRCCGVTAPPVLHGTGL